MVGAMGDLIELTPRQTDILHFEESWWKYAGAKEAAIREKFDVSPTRYYQELQAILDMPAAIAAQPMLTRRLKRIRDRRRAQRSARARLG